MSNNSRESFPVLRIIVAIGISLCCCVIIWIITPYNNFILKTGFISDDYLPRSALTILIVLVLAVNPFLRIIHRRWALDFRQMALVLGIMFIAASISSSGLLRYLPYSLAMQVSNASEWKEVSSYYEKANLKPSLFPAKLGYHENIENVRQFLVKLPEGDPIPWQTWLSPAISWLIFFMFLWMMCISLSGIMLPQWQQTERVSFPLTHILRSLLETPEDGRLVPVLFREKWFWIAAVVVFAVHALVGLQTYFPGQVPAFQTTWNLTPLFTEEPLSYMPEYMKRGQFYFILIGVAYFMSTRVSFSIWFFMAAYALYTMLCQMYTPPFSYDAPVAHRTGALLTITVSILWLGRTRWVEVFHRLTRTVHSEEHIRDRNLGWMFILGLLGMVGWLIWAGVQPQWAVLLVSIIFIYQLVISRIVAETGLPLVGLVNRHFWHYFSFIPIRLISGATAWFIGALSAFIGNASRVSIAAFAMQSMSLDEDAPPRHQWQTARFYLIILVLGFFICGAAHIYFSYHHSQTLDSDPEVPISAWGSYQLNLAVDLLREQIKQEWNKSNFNKSAHILFGTVLAGGLQYASLIMPKWPLHPVGLLLSYTWFGETVWMSVAMGWLLRIVLILFGGARLYRKMRPLFIGMIIGEVFAVMVWFSVPAVLAFRGKPYQIINIIPF